MIKQIVILFRRIFNVKKDFHYQGFIYLDKDGNVVDMTTSQNVDRIYQLLCRVIRKHPEGQKKLFFKIALNIHSDYYKYIMTAVLSLSDEKFFTKFNGKNFSDTIIPVIKRKQTHIKNNNNIKTNKSRPKTMKPIDFEGLPVFEFFKNLYHKKDALLHTYAQTTIRDVRAEFLNYTPNGYWTKEKCIKSALKYNYPEEWLRNEGGAYGSSKINNWYEECIKHMNIGKNGGYWTFERCKEDALKYQSLKEWRKNSETACGVAKRKGWYPELIKHMHIDKINWTKDLIINTTNGFTKMSDWRKSNPQAYQAAGRLNVLSEIKDILKPRFEWSKEKCIEEALKYKTIKEWRENSSGSYSKAKRMGWIKECHKYLVRLTRKPWTKNELIKEANKFKTITEWQKNSSGSYDAARNMNIVDICSKHMIRKTKPNNYWSLELCKEEGLKHKTKKEWRKSSGGSYAKAYKMGWLDMCCEHMETLSKPNGYWKIKENCVNSAKQYNTISGWKKSSDCAAYHSARKNNWLDECTKHMKK